MSNNIKEKELSAADEDGKLVSLCKKGDISAFESLVIKYQKRMFNIAYRMTGNYEDSCEIVQDAFVSAYRNIKNFEKKARFSTWLYAIEGVISKILLSTSHKTAYRGYCSNLYCCNCCLSL